MFKFAPGKKVVQSCMGDKPALQPNPITRNGVAILKKIPLPSAGILCQSKFPPLAVEKSKMPIKANIIPIEQMKIYFHVASSARRLEW